MKKTIILILLLVFLLSCTQQTEIECTQDSECSKAGCSSQICTTADKAKDIVTSCEWKDEYECYTDAKCSCVEGKCQWIDVEECLNKFS